MHSGDNKPDLRHQVEDLQQRIDGLEKALLESEEKFRSLADFAPVGIFLDDAQGNAIYVNKKCAELVGVPAEDALNLNWIPFLHPDDREIMVSAWEEAFKNSSEFHLEYRWVHLDGKVVWTLGEVVPIMGDNGKATLFVGILTDITARKEGEEELRESAKILNEAVRAGRIGLWNWDLKTNNVIYSSEWKRQIGYEDHEISDDYSEWENRVHPDDLQSVIAVVEKSVKEINQDHRTEFRFRHKDGSYRWILSQGSFLLDAEGHPIKFLGSHIDITSLKKLEKNLLQSQKMESIGTLAGGIAHDFNNILSAVLGYTELALDAVEKATPVEEDLQGVYRAGIRAKDLVQQILTFARQSDEALKPIQVDLIIKEVLKFIRSSIPTTIEIKQNIASDSRIMGNSTQVHQIMMNLCTNAAHAMQDEGGTLEITLKDITIDRTTKQKRLKLKFGNYIELKVSDTGAGMEPHIIEKIFEPYFTTKKPGEGTGMGLALVHGIVATYGGEMIVESTLGTGTVFTMYLPIAKGKNTPLAHKSNELPTGQERILFVDDEAPIAKIAGRLLAQLGYSVTTRTSSVEALELFRSKPNDFDLVISDVTMPQMAGDQLTQKLIEIRPDIPVILCTGYNKRLSEKKGLEIAIKALIPKPIIKEELAIKVRKVLDEARNGS